MFNYDLKVHYDYDVSMGGNWKELKNASSNYTRQEVINVLQCEGHLGEAYECYRNYR
jgi:hypothetical protein